MFFSSSGNKADDLPFLTDFYLVLCLLNLEKEDHGLSGRPRLGSCPLLPFVEPFPLPFCAHREEGL